MDDLKENQLEPERPPKGSIPSNYRLITYDAESSNHSDWGGDVLFACLRRTVSGRTERMSKGNKRNRILYTDQHILKESKARGKI